MQHISVTEAKKLFGLSDRDLEKVPIQAVERPKKRNASYIDFAEAKKVALKKHGGEDGLQYFQEMRGRNGKARHQEAMQSRENTLRQMFAEKAVEFPQQCMLCSRYITTGFGKPSDILQLHIDLDFLTRNTTYQEDLKYAHQYMSGPVIENAKQLAVSKWCVHNPDRVNELPMSLHKYQCIQ